MKAWTKGTVTSKVNVRSYNVNTDEGQAFRRNRRDIRINRGTSEQPKQPVDLDLPDSKGDADNGNTCSDKTDQSNKYSQAHEPDISDDVCDHPQITGDRIFRDRPDRE